MTIGRVGGTDNAAQRSRRVSLLRAMPSRLRDAFVLQRAQRHASRGRSDGPHDALPEQHRQSPDGRSERAAACPACTSSTRDPRKRESTGRAWCFSAHRRSKARAFSSIREAAQFPNGLANSSGQVGRNMMDHIKWGGADGDFDGWTDRQVIGDGPNGIYIPRFANVRPDSTDFVRGYGYQGGARGQGWQERHRLSGHRRGIQAAAERARPVGDDPQRLRRDAAARLRTAALHPRTGRRVGHPDAAHRVRVGTQRTGDSQAHERSAAEMLEASGAIRVRPSTRISTPGNTNHEMGTARMGRERQTSVLNGWNQAWDVAEPVRHRRRLHDFERQPEPVAHLHGAYRARGHYAVEALKRGDV